MNLVEEFKYIDEFFDNISDEELFQDLIKCGLKISPALKKEHLDNKLKGEDNGNNESKL